MSQIIFLAGYVAHEMGLPIRMVAAVTPNDIVHRTLQSGDFSLSEVVLQTWATAMDIQVKIIIYHNISNSSLRRFPTM